MLRRRSIGGQSHGRDFKEVSVCSSKLNRQQAFEKHFSQLFAHSLFPAKDNTYISRRYQNILDPTLKKGPLANEEIVAALELYRDIEKTNDYPSIAKSMNHQQGQKSAIFSENAFFRVWIASALAKTKMRNSSLDRMKL